MPDLVRLRRESMRWNIINTLNMMRPYQTHERQMLEIMQSIYVDATALEVRRELDYLADRLLVDLKKENYGVWFADLSRHGADVAEYTIPCEPGIARPVKVWED